VRADEQDIGIASPVSILRATDPKMSAAWIGSESASGASAMTSAIGHVLRKMAGCSREAGEWRFALFTS